MDANQIFLDSFAQKLYFVKDSQGALATVSRTSICGVVQGEIYNLGFPERKVAPIWVGINHSRIRINMHFQNYTMIHGVFELFQKALANAVQIGWHFQVSNQDVNGVAFGTIHLNLVVDPQTFTLAGANTLTSLGSYYLVETAHVIQMLISVLENQNMRCPDNIMPGPHFAPLSSYHHPTNLLKK